MKTQLQVCPQFEVAIEIYITRLFVKGKPVHSLTCTGVEVCREWLLNAVIEAGSTDSPMPYKVRGIIRRIKSLEAFRKVAAEMVERGSVPLVAISLEQAANYFTASNLAIWEAVTAADLYRVSHRGYYGPTMAEDFDCRTIALNILADGCGEDEAERCWESESASWRQTIRKENKTGYCHTELAKMGFTIVK